MYFQCWAAVLSSALILLRAYRYLAASYRFALLWDLVVWRATLNYSLHLTTSRLLCLFFLFWTWMDRDIVLCPAAHQVTCTFCGHCCFAGSWSEVPLHTSRATTAQTTASKIKSLFTRRFSSSSLSHSLKVAGGSNNMLCHSSVPGRSRRVLLVI